MEKWRPAVGFGGRYDVSSLGRVRSKLRSEIKILKPQVDYRGYRFVGLSKGREQRQLRVKVGRLVLEAFRGLQNGFEVDHRDRDRGNDRLTNLRWATRLQNIQGRGPFIKSSSKGVPGVSLYINNARPNQSGKWRAFAKVGGRLYHIGYYSTIEEASSARASWFVNQGVGL